MKKQLLWVWIACTSCLMADEKAADFIPHAVTEMGVSAMVQNCVNAITGDFVDQGTDLVLEGPEPLSFERFFVSSARHLSGLYAGWKHNHQSWIETASGKITFKRDGDKHHALIAKYMDKSGRGTFYSKREGRVQDLDFNLSASGKGYTNCAEGIISARTNLKNTTIGYQNGEVEYKAANGYRYTFEREKNIKHQHVYSLSKEQKPNGHLIHYKYDKETRLTEAKLTDVTGQKVYSSFTLNHLPMKNLKDDKRLHCDLIGSDGRSIRYVLERIHPKDDDGKDNKKIDFYCVTEVQRPYAPTEKYTYFCWEYPKLMRKERPEGRTLSIDYYYASLDETVAGHKVRGDSKMAFMSGRVQSISAPLGPNGTLVPIQSFIYKPNVIKHKHEDHTTQYTSDDIEGGYTKVYDALNHKTHYVYDSEFRLTEISKFSGTLPNHYVSYSTERIFWGENDTPQEGFLLGKCVQDSAGNTWNGRRFEYDRLGNIVKDTFYGNISGHSQPLIWQDKVPLANGCESYSIAYTYSSEHLMLEEREDNGKGTLYRYRPGSDLLACKLVTENGVIRIRHFYDYDSDAVLIQTIVDDGLTENKDDLTGVTERKITLIRPRQEKPFGLPESMEEYYLDLATNNLVFLKRIKNEHNRIGRLMKQEVYDANKQLAYTLEWAYNDHGLVTMEKNALGEIIRRSYDDNDNLKEEISATKRLVHQYDLGNRKIATQTFADKLCFTTTYRYDYLGNCLATIDHFGQETNHFYDDLNRPILTLFPAISGSRPQLQKQYDLFGNVITTIDSNGGVTTQLYNAKNKPTFIRYADGTQEHFEYHLDGTLSKSIAKNGSITLHTYDFLGRPIEKNVYSPHMELLATSQCTYNAFHLTSTTDPSGLTTFYTYDGAGRLIQEQKGAHLTTYAYDTLGRRMQTRERYGENAERLTICLYDALDRIKEERIEENGALLRRSTFGYDVDGNCISQAMETDGGIALTKTEYNAFKQPTKIVDALGNTTLFTYNYSAFNAYGQMVLETNKIDPLGMQTVTTLNVLGKPDLVVKKNSFGKLLSKKELLYNAVGDCIRCIETVVTPQAADRTVTTLWEYDACHQLRHLTEAAGTPEQKHIRYHYNAFGQKERIEKPDGISIIHTYDVLGRLSALQSSDKSLSYTYHYDLSNRPIRIDDLLHNTQTLRTYDETGRMKEEHLGNGLRMTYSYDDLDRPLTLTLPDDTAIQYTYDALHLREVQRIKNGRECYKHHYAAYNAYGSATKMNYAGCAGIEQCQYDLLGRMTQSKMPHYSEQITYDSVGNLTAVKVNDVLNQYRYDDTYQLQSEQGSVNHTYLCDSLYNCVNKDGISRTFNSLNQLLTHGDANYRYDANGNLISKNENGKTTTYSYDGLDRLTNVTIDQASYSYIYDAFNRRLSKQTAAKTEHYLYQGQNEIGMFDTQIAQLRILGVGKGAEIGAAIAIEIGGQTAIPIHDHNGNVTLLLDHTNGNLIEKYQYSAFGEENSSSSFGNPWRYSSKRHDPETGFVYFGRRYYDPTTCRWVTPDPLSFEGGPNLYAYVLNSPLNHIDLYGLMAINRQYAKPWSLQDGISSYPIFKWLSNTMGKIPGMQTLGSMVYAVGRHFTPIPIMDSIVRTLGNFMQGKSLTWQTIWGEEHSKLETVGTNQYHPNVTYGFTPGMNNPSNDAREVGEGISKDLDGHIVHVGSNGTHGTFFDTMECVVQYFGIITNAVARTLKSFHERASLALRDVLGACYQEGFSQGGLVIYEALRRLTAAERSRFHVVTYGSAKIINPKELGLAYAHNYVCWTDFVPFIGDPIGVIRGLLAPEPYVTFVPGLWPYWNSHCFSNPSYQERHQQHLGEFKKMYKGSR